MELDLLFLLSPFPLFLSIYSSPFLLPPSFFPLLPPFQSPFHSISADLYFSLSLPLSLAFSFSIQTVWNSLLCSKSSFWTSKLDGIFFFFRLSLFLFSFLVIYCFLPLSVILVKASVFHLVIIRVVVPYCLFAH